MAVSVAANVRSSSVGSPLVGPEADALDEERFPALLPAELADVLPGEEDGGTKDDEPAILLDSANDDDGPVNDDEGPCDEGPCDDAGALEEDTTPLPDNPAEEDAGTRDEACALEDRAPLPDCATDDDAWDDPSNLEEDSTWLPEEPPPGGSSEVPFWVHAAPNTHNARTGVFILIVLFMG